MTTIVDPAGTPAPVYRDPSTTVLEMDGAGPNDAAHAAVIPMLTQYTVLIATVTSDGARSYKFSADTEIGDMIEIHNGDAGHNPLIFPASGENIAGGNSITLGSACQVFRKTSSTDWRKVV